MVIGVSKAEVLQFASLLRLSLFVNLVAHHQVGAYKDAGRLDRRAQRTFTRAGILDIKALHIVEMHLLLKEETMLTY